MKNNLTSLELHYLVEELQFLVDSKIDKIYHPKKEELILQFHVPGAGKQILRILSGKFLYLASVKESVEEPSGFCMFLRKYLDNSRLRKIRQLDSERIVEFVFEKGEKRRMVVEFFGGGNIILCNDNNAILSALVLHKWKDREIKAKMAYSYPKKEYTLFNLKLNELKDIFMKSDQNLVKCLATKIGLGGSYSEEVCLLSNIDKNFKPSELDEKEIKGIFDSINKLIKNKVKPSIIYKEKEVLDIVPFDLKIYGGFEKKELSKYNGAFDYYFLNEFKEVKKKTKQEKEIERLTRMIIHQDGTIKELENKETKEREKGDLIYQNYELVNDIITELRKASKKYEWNEIERRLKGHKTIKSVNSKDKTVEIEI